MKKENVVDVAVKYEGKISLMYPKTKAAKAWIAENVDPDSLKWGEALVVEDRYLGSIAFAMSNAGLVVQ
jgi:hypothetical protein